MLLDLPSLPFAGVCVCVRVLCTIIPGCEGQEDFAMHQLWLKYNQVVKIIIIIILLLLLILIVIVLYTFIISPLSLDLRFGHFYFFTFLDKDPCDISVHLPTIAQAFIAR